MRSKSEPENMFRIFTKKQIIKQLKSAREGPLLRALKAPKKGFLKGS